MPFKNIDAKTLKEWLENHEAVLVDVREPSEYSAKNINGSVLIPLGSISRDAMPDFSGKKLVINCHGGKRGGLACEKIISQDSDIEIYNLEGGLSAWEKEGLPLEKSGQDSDVISSEFCSIKPRS